MISYLKIIDFIIPRLSWKDSDSDIRTRSWKSQLTAALNMRSFKGFSIYIYIYIYTSRGTRLCPEWPVAKPGSNGVYHITKKEDGINCGNVSEWNMRHVTYERAHNLRKRRQHCEWIKCVVRHLIGKQRHVTKLECYHLFEMSLKFFVFPSGAGM